MDYLLQNIIEYFFGRIDPIFIVFIISMIPILELRGGMIAASLLGINWKMAMIICILGNIVPAPFILLFLNKVFNVIKKTRFSKFAYYFEKKADEKSKKILRYKKFGLFLFVAIPVPGTGAWTGAMVASILGFDLRSALVSILLGVGCAAVIMTIFSYGILGLFI